MHQPRLAISVESYEYFHTYLFILDNHSEGFSCHFFHMSSMTLCRMVSLCVLWSAGRRSSDLSDYSHNTLECMFLLEPCHTFVLPVFNQFFSKNHVMSYFVGIFSK